MHTQKDTAYINIYLFLEFSGFSRSISRRADDFYRFGRREKNSRDV